MSYACTRTKYAYKLGAKDSAGRQWVLHSSLDDGNASPPPPPSAAQGSDPTSGVAAARALFQSKASRGQDKGTSNTHISSVLQHSRAITGISIARGDQTLLTTSSLDGKIVLWDLQSTMLNIDASNMGLR